MALVKVATVWLGGCSGCHMSFLDMDEWLIDLAGRVELVYSPIADVKAYPDGVDVALVEGAVANKENEEMAHVVRARTKVLISFGDCAVTGNVTSYRNPLGGALPVLQRSYIELPDLNARLPEAPGILPRLLEKVLPVHAVVEVDAYLPGCPPPADRIRKVLETLLAGKPLQLQGKDIKFG